MLDIKSKELDKLEVKETNNFLLVKRWLENKNAKKTFVDYFHQYGYTSIAIYGAGDLGKLLYEEVKDSDIKVKYFVDRNGEGIHQIDQIPVTTISHVDEMEDVDILVVTLVNSYNAICETLARYAPQVRTLSIIEAVYEI